MIAFSLGCLTFEVPADELPATDAEWCRTVTRSLKELASVSDVKVSVRGTQEEPYPARIEERFDFTDSPQAGGFCPHPLAGEIRFRIRIPQHLQDHLLDEIMPGKKSRAGAEEFHVLIRYNRRFPVAVIWLPDSSLTASPRDALIAVREFLTRELKIRSSLRASVIGPTPAWSDCFLAAGALPAGQSFDVSYTPGAYRHVFTYNEDEFGDDAAALETLVARLSTELSVYYLQQVLRNRRMTRWSYVQNDTRALIAMHGKTGFLAAIGRVFRSGELEREVSLRILSAMLTEDEERRKTDGWILRLYAEEPLQPWRFFIEEVIAESYQPQLAYSQKIVELLGQRRTKELEVSIVAAATLLGGLAGAVAAVLTG